MGGAGTLLVREEDSHERKLFLFKPLKTALAHSSDSGLFIPQCVTRHSCGSHLHFFMSLISKYILTNPNSLPVFY